MILIIDDDAAVRSSLTFLLKRAGFRPEAVPGPKEALEVDAVPRRRIGVLDGYELHTDYHGRGGGFNY